jgi:DNA-binding transcriptional ArsR family regulator
VSSRPAIWQAPGRTSPNPCGSWEPCRGPLPPDAHLVVLAWPWWAGARVPCRCARAARGHDHHYRHRGSRQDGAARDERCRTGLGDRLSELWRQTRDDQLDSLCALLGKTRAALLAKLALPSTTTQLAGQLAISPAAVSQQLKILKDTALVSAESAQTASEPDRCV